MSARAPLSPSQYESFGLARALLMYDTWAKLHGEPLATDRAMLLDFVAQHPRSFENVVPALGVVLRGHGLSKHDLSDLFALRRFSVLRERFTVTVSGLLARGLLLSPAREPDSGTEFEISATGTNAAETFSSAFSLGYRAVLQVLCSEWHRRKLEELREDIREMLPNEALAIAELSSELPQWLGDEA